MPDPAQQLSDAELLNLPYDDLLKVILDLRRRVAALEETAIRVQPAGWPVLLDFPAQPEYEVGYAA